MTNPLTVILKVSPKNSAELEAVYARMVKTVRNEEGTITYRMFRTDDDTVYLYEDYVSSQAFLAHFGNMQESGLLDQWMAAGEITEVLCLGTPSDEARNVLAGLGATFAEHVAGFSRLELHAAAAQH